MVLQYHLQGWQQSQIFKIMEKIEKNQFADKTSLDIQNMTKFSKNSNTAL